MPASGRRDLIRRLKVKCWCISRRIAVTTLCNVDRRTFYYLRKKCVISVGVVFTSYFMNLKWFNTLCLPRGYSRTTRLRFTWHWQRKSVTTFEILAFILFKLGLKNSNIFGYYALLLSYTTIIRDTQFHFPKDLNLWTQHYGKLKSERKIIWFPWYRSYSQSV